MLHIITFIKLFTFTVIQNDLQYIQRSTFYHVSIPQLTIG